MNIMLTSKLKLFTKMKTYYLILIGLSFFIGLNQLNGQIGIGTETPDASSVLDLTSTNKGALLPRMTESQRNAITDPAMGLMVFNTNTNCLNFWSGYQWVGVCGEIAPANFPVNSLYGGNNIEYPLYGIQTKDGGYITAGFSNSSISGNVSASNKGGDDIWILKLAANGSVQWDKSLGGNSTDHARSIEQTSDGGYIVCGYTSSSNNGDVAHTNHGNSDFWIIKLDAAGNVQWDKLYGGNGNEQGIYAHQTTDGGYIVTGHSTSSNNGDVTHTNHGNSDIWVLKLDAAGNIQWNQLYGGNGGEDSYSIKQTIDGGYIVSGFSNSSQNGNVSDVNNGGNDYWILKLDSSGNIEWDKLYGGANNDQAITIRQTTDGGYVIGGFSNSSQSGDISQTNNGGSDYWIVKLDILGNLEWEKLYGGTDEEQNTFTIQTNDGGYLLAGWTQSSGSGDVAGTNKGLIDVWLIKLDRTGNKQWEKLYGANGVEQAVAVAQTQNGGYAVFGASTSQNNGDVTQANNGSYDFWMFTIDSNGNILE